MKKSLLFAATLAMFCSASADVQQLVPRSIQDLNVKQLRAEMAIASKAKAPRVNKAAAPTRAADLVTPEGEIKYYSASGYFYSMFGMMYQELATTVAIAPDGKTVYFNSIFPDAMTDIWTPAVIDGETATIDCENVIGYYGDYELTVGEFVLDEDQNIVGFKDLELTKGGDGFYMDDDDFSPSRYAALLAFAGGEFQGYLSYALLLDFEPVEVGEPVTLPEGATPTEYIYEYLTYSGNKVIEKALGYVDGNDMYLNNLTPSYPAWVKGTIEGNQVTFKAGQYLGMNSYFLYFNPFTFDGDDPLYDEGTITAADLVFNIDENGVLTQANPEVYCSCSYTPDADKLFDYGSAFKVSPFLGYAFDIPSDPSDLFIEDYWDYYGQNYFGYTLVNMGVNGQFLDPDSYFYTLYLDDEPYAVGPDNFAYISEEMVEIPLNYIDENGGYDLAPGYAYISENLFETIGIQGIYYYEGQPYYTNIVSVDMEGNVYVTEVENGTPTNISTLYSQSSKKAIYNVMGQKINAVAPGFNIVDGKKVIK